MIERGQINDREYNMNQIMCEKKIKRPIEPCIFLECDCDNIN